FLLLFLTLRPPPRPSLFPYTTLFRSACVARERPGGGEGRGGVAILDGAGERRRRERAQCQLEPFVVPALPAQPPAEIALRDHRPRPERLDRGRDARGHLRRAEHRGAPRAEDARFLGADEVERAAE